MATEKQGPAKGERRMEASLEGRVAVITGASAGIGTAIARSFARHGAKVILNARRGETLRRIQSELDETMGVEAAYAVEGDCADPAVITAMLDAGPEHFGKPADLFVVNAGRGLGGSVVSSDDESWEEMVKTNVMGAARLMRAAALSMAENTPQGGDDAEGDWQEHARDIVVIGSTVGRHISPFSSMYGGTKFAVHSLAEALRRELAPSGIRVSLVEPGIVETEFQGVAGYDPDKFGKLMHEKGPVLQPADVAETITFMVSRPARICLGDVVIRGTRQDYP